MNTDKLKKVGDAIKGMAADSGAMKTRMDSMSGRRRADAVTEDSVEKMFDKAYRMLGKVLYSNDIKWAGGAAGSLKEAEQAADFMKQTLAAMESIEWPAKKWRVTQVKQWLASVERVAQKRQGRK